jgi:hypothetical protein
MSVEIVLGGRQQGRSRIHIAPENGDDACVMDCPVRPGQPGPVDLPEVILNALTFSWRHH